VSPESNFVDKQKIVSAIEEYLPSNKTRVKWENVPGQSDALSNKDDHEEINSGGKWKNRADRQTQPAPITSVHFNSEDSSTALVLEMKSDDGREFSISVPWDALPDGNPGGASSYDIEHRIASELLAWIDETTFLYTVSELDGKSLCDL
jgi:hypothetical protein